MSEEIQNVTPTEPVEAEQVQQVENTSEATAEEPKQEEQQQEEQQKEEAKKEPWFQKRINEQTRKFYEAQREAQALKERLAYYERQQYQQPEEQQFQQPQVDLESLAEQKAAQLLAERSFNDACNKVYEMGVSELPGFQESVSNLQLVGVTRQFLEAATSVDAGHKVLGHLGKIENLPEAERILSLPPVQMGMELARLSMKLSQSTPKPVSKAPPPISPVGGGRTSTTDLASASIEDYIAMRKKQGARWAK